jgi:hypothetical protein
MPPVKEGGQNCRPCRWRLLSPPPQYLQPLKRGEYISVPLDLSAAALIHGRLVAHSYSYQPLIPLKCSSHLISPLWPPPTQRPERRPSLSRSSMASAFLGDPPNSLSRCKTAAFCRISASTLPTRERRHAPLVGIRPGIWLHSPSVNWARFMEENIVYCCTLDNPGVQHGV